MKHLKTQRHLGLTHSAIALLSALAPYYCTICVHVSQQLKGSSFMEKSNKSTHLFSGIEGDICWVFI